MQSEVKFSFELITGSDADYTTEFSSASPLNPLKVSPMKRVKKIKITLDNVTPNADGSRPDSYIIHISVHACFRYKGISYIWSAN